MLVLYANDMLYNETCFLSKYVDISMLSMPAEIDLANLNGQMMNLPRHQSAVASDVLVQREEYILVSISRKEIENLY